MSVVITIPIYREDLTITEKISLQQLRRVLGKYPCVFVAPESLKFAYEGLEKDIAVERFPDQWFTSITSYSRLLLNESYYARFAEYDYLLIYQLDAFVFADRLQEFCELGYDYIGAPIAPYNPIWHAIGARVGNGGLSLRKIAAARRSLRQWEKMPRERQQIFHDVFLRVEDAFWGWCGVQKDFEFQCAPLQVALQFSVQEEVQDCYRRIAEGSLKVFGCHGWDGTHASFWRGQIEALGYDLSTEESLSGISRRCDDLRSYWQKRRYIDLIRLWGALRKRRYTSMTILLLGWLDCYPAGDTKWEGLGEELQYLWRCCRQERLEQPAAKIELERLEHVLVEAICRTLQTGSWQEHLPWLLESILPQIQEVKTLATEELGKTVENIRWQEWENSASYAKPAPSSVKKYHIVAIAMVRNEMDIIESFVRHTLSFADELLILDHYSSDKTSAILTALQQEGLPLSVQKVSRVEYAQAELTTELMYEAINDHGADIVIPLDTDEFLVGTAAGKNVREWLEELDDSIVYELPWRRYILYQPHLRRDEFILSRPVIGDVYRDSGQKCIVGARSVMRYKLKLVQGNHRVYYEQNGQQIDVEMQRCQSMELAHFYWRSQEQFQTKIAVGWPNIVARYSLASVAGGGYRNYHQRMIKGEMISPLEFLKQGSLMDLRPFVEPQILRYSQETTPQPMGNLMKASVLLAERVAEQQMLAQKILVTTVVPYMGQMEDFTQRLQQAVEQDYPWQQLLIPCLQQTGEIALHQINEICQKKIQGKYDWDVFGYDEIQDVFSQLSAKAKGKFVHWQLPGTEVANNFLKRMVSAGMEQIVPLQVVVSDAREDYSNEYPYIMIHPLDNTQVALGNAFWQRLMEIGKYPAGDITAALITREAMDNCGWLCNSFLLPEGKRLPFTAWKVLLSAVGDGFVGVISDCYACPESKVMSLENLVIHQLEWWELLQLEKTTWKSKDLRETVQLFCRNGEKILTRALASGCNTTTSLWQRYQQVLLQSSNMF